MLVAVTFDVIDSEKFGRRFAAANAFATIMLKAIAAGFLVAFAGNAANYFWVPSMVLASVSVPLQSLFFRLVISSALGAKPLFLLIGGVLGGIGFKGLESGSCPGPYLVAVLLVALLLFFGCLGHISSMGILYHYSRNDTNWRYKPLSPLSNVTAAA